MQLRKIKSRSRFEAIINLKKSEKLLFTLFGKQLRLIKKLPNVNISQHQNVIRRESFKHSTNAILNECLHLELYVAPVTGVKIKSIALPCLFFIYI